jgi:hypothetical protein
MKTSITNRGFAKPLFGMLILRVGPPVHGIDYTLEEIRLDKAKK